MTLYKQSYLIDLDILIHTWLRTYALATWLRMKNKSETFL